jgi:DNA helicase-2/ATP-dependent DNA helicase PcrA
LELRGQAEEYRGLPLVTFLENIALVSDVDTRDDDENRPSLLTLHAAKGLEFPAVFIVGLEENILPHARSIAPERNPNASPEEKQAVLEAIEEERRLMYVGITRAEQRLYLIYAAVRSLYGESRANLPSRFLYDIPESAREGAALSRRARADRDRQGFGRLTSWDRAVSVEDGRKSTERGAPTRYRGGDTVWHVKFGEGVVISSAIKSGMEMVEVLFPGGAGQKTIMADFLKRMGS